MLEEREYRASVEAAERAAEKGDFVRAEALLREGLRMQERVFGAAHPDLASTLNNLAVVCETNGRLDDAEQFYRRAVAVATAALSPTDTRVITSRANLRDFCAAHGLSIDEWPEVVGRPPSPAALSTAPWARPDPAAVPAPPPAAAAPVVAAARPAPAPPARPAPRSLGSVQVHPPARTTARHGAPVGLIGALAILAVAATAAVGWLWVAVPMQPQAVADANREPSGAAAPAPSNPARPSAPAGPGPAPHPPTPTPTPTPTPAAPVAAPPAAAPGPAASAPAPPAATAPAPALASSGLRIVTADVCRTLERSGAWRCDPVGTPAAAGPATYYTRVASPRSVRLEHRWYRDGELTRAVGLEVAANPTQGYRTFSRQTLTPGRWRVELRAPDGAVLHELAIDVPE